MRGVSHILLFAFLGSVLAASPAYAGLGDIIFNTPPPGQNNNSNNNDNDNETDEYLNQLDEDYQNSVDQVNSTYEASTNAINDGSYEDYTSRLDSTLEAMYEDINNGGTAAGLPTAGKYTPPKIPSSGSNESTTSTQTTSTQGGGTQTSSSNSSSAEEEEELPSDPRIAMVLQVCTPMCTPAGGQFDQGCASACARQVLGVPSQEVTFADTLMMMSILNE